MDTPDQIRSVAARFFDAIERSDSATVLDSFAPDAPIWHNTDDKEVTPQHIAKVLEGSSARVRDRQYAERRLHVFPGGFVQQHVLIGTRTHDGVAVRLPACLVCAVEGGKITRLDEYFDSAHVAEFRKYADQQG